VYKSVGEFKNLKFTPLFLFCVALGLFGSYFTCNLMKINLCLIVYNKFKELILTARGASLKLKGKIYTMCIQSVMKYGSETWPMKMEDIQHLQRAEIMMVRWMCGVTLRDRVTSDELLSLMKVNAVFEVVRQNRLRWFGHVYRKSDDNWVKKCQQLLVEGKAGRGRGRKTWLHCIRRDMKELELKVDDFRDRQIWKGKISLKRMSRASMENRR